MMSESFWSIPAQGDEKSPIVILREQANALTEATGGKLRGDVSTQRWGDDLMISLNVVVPALDNYTLELIKYQQPLLMYPGRIETILKGHMFFQVENEAKFIDGLKTVLSDPETQKILGRLLSQVEQP